MKLYTAEELLTWYKGRYIDTYPHHYEKRDNKGNWVSLWEVRSVSRVIRENHETPEQVINS